MTRDEAIEVLQQDIPCEQDTDLIEALDMAIEALNQEPCEDSISRQAVIEQTYNWSKDEFLRVTNPFDYLRKRINSLPSVNPQEPKTGHWNCGDDMFEYAICSSCKHETGEAWEYAKRNFKFCPNCGTKMRGD